jgi:hypothetical protein
VLLGYGIRDLVAPSRLGADTGGVDLIAGFATRRRLGWDEIDRIRVEQRRRLGTRSQLLEVDTGDTLYLFSDYDLGTSCWSAARTLATLAPPGLVQDPD